MGCTDARLVLRCLVVGVAALNAITCGDRSPSGPSGDTDGSRFVSVLVTVGSPGLPNLTPGMTAHANATGKRPTGEYEGCTQSAVWRSSNTAVASVSSEGFVVALSPGTTMISATCSGTTGGAQVDVYLGANLSGTVTDQAGAPLADVRVGIQNSKYGTGTTTDAAGHYRMTGIVRGGTYPVWLQKDGYERASTSVTLSEAETVANFSLQRGFSISGRVTEAGLGPLAGATVTIVSGPAAGTSTVTSSVGVTGYYSFQHLLPGRFTLRATKAGYDGAEQTIDASKDTTLDFVLKSSYGTCLVFVDPLKFELFPSAGGDATIKVGANPGRAWTAVPDQPWVQISSSPGGTGPGAVQLHVLPSPAGAVDLRTAAVRVGCGPNEGQNVQLSQLPDCQTTLSWAADSAISFGATGGTAHLVVQTGTPGCHWFSTSTVDWVRPVGVSSWYGSLDAYFTVLPNATGLPRVGTVVVGEKPWEIGQAPQ